MCAILGRKRPSRRGTVWTWSAGTLVRIILPMQYHLSIPGLLRSIDESFRDCLTPIDACAKDVEEEGFQPVCFGHKAFCGAQEMRKLSMMRLIVWSQSNSRSIKYMYRSTTSMISSMLHALSFPNHLLECEPRRGTRGDGDASAPSGNIF